MKFWFFVLLALALGLWIGWIDTRPTWDDTGVTATTILGVAAAFGAAMPKHAWVWALAVGGGTLILNIALQGNYGALISLLFAFIGSYSGVLLRKTISG